MKGIKAIIAEYLAEFLGTFFLTFVIFISKLFAQDLAPYVIGLVLIPLIFVFGRYGKAHFNPAVTIGDFVVVIIRSIKNAVFPLTDLLKFLGYLIVQLVAVFGSFFIVNLFKTGLIAYIASANQVDVATVVEQYGPKFALSTTYIPELTLMAFVLEALLTFVLVLTILSVANNEKTKSVAPFIIGITLFIIVALAGQLTGASFHPFRSLVPAIFTGGEALGQLWVYLAAPTVGGIVAGFVYAIFRWLEIPDKPSTRVVASKVPASRVTNKEGKKKKK